MPFAALPETMRLAVLVGDPLQPGQYVIRVRAQGGARLMPHRHPEDRIYTIISGVFYVGLGETFDDSKLRAYAAGTVIVLPGNTWPKGRSRQNRGWFQGTAQVPWWDLKGQSPSRSRLRQKVVNNG